MAAKTRSKAAIRAASLRKAGFNASVDRQSGYVRFSCDSCQAMAINGIACHEKGCPNEKRDDD